MLWIFISLGLVSLMSALHGLSTTWSRGGRMLAMHFLALVLLGVAWAAEHTSTAGWVALGAGAAVELVDWWLWLFSRRVRGGAMPPPVLERTAAAPGRVRLAGSRAEDSQAPTAGSAVESIVPPAPGADSEQDGADSADAMEDDDSALPEQALPATEPNAVVPTIDDAPGDGLAPSEGIPQTEPAPAAPVEPVTEGPSESQPVEEPVVPESDASADETAVAYTDAPAEISSPISSISTTVLIKTKCDVAPGVFFASLRRSGQRDARLVEAPDAVGETWIQAGQTLLKLRTETGPCDPSELEEALAATTDGPEDASITADHEARVVIVSEYAGDTPHDEVIRLLHRAHAALAEFAPVVAVLWTEAGRLVRAAEIANLSVLAADMASPMAETCVRFRTFALSEPNDGLFLSDCVGLHALGLPDIQFITQGEPGKVAIDALHGLAERFLTTGCNLADGAAFDMEDGQAWRVTHTLGAFPPDREVIQITVKR